MRDRYGRTLFGQSTLLARKLVEEGINCVAVFNGQHNGQDANWDSHANIFPRHRQLIPPYDQALSALIDDLADRGLLESTLVVSMAEFGRTPKINGAAGRDHWPDCYTVCFAGGGIRGGEVHGASDRIAAYPDRDPVTPGDLVATILWRFGIEELAHIAQLASIVVLDRNGEVLTQTNPLPTIDPDLSKLALFEAHRDGRGPPVILSEPFLGGPVATSWRFVVSRRFTGFGGAFEGVLAAIMEIDRFDRLYQTIDVGEGGFIALLSLDGVMITRVPDPAGVKGKKFNNTDIYKR